MVLGPVVLAQTHGSVGQLGGEHRQGAPGQIKAGGTPACLQVQGTAGRDKAAGIGDVNPEAGGMAFAPFDRQTIVDVLGVFVVDREQTLVGQVQPADVAGHGTVGGGHQSIGFGQQFGAETQLPGGGLQGR